MKAEQYSNLNHDAYETNEGRRSRLQADNCLRAAALATDTAVKILKPLPALLPLKTNQKLAEIYQRYAEQMGESFVLG